jgi:hypothetical protein
MPTVAVPLAPLLGALLTVAAIAKIRRFGAWRTALDGYRLVPARRRWPSQFPPSSLASPPG